MTDAAGQICGQDARDGYILAKLEHREELPVYKTKSHMLATFPKHPWLQQEWRKLKYTFLPSWPLGRVEKSKNGFGSNGYYFLNVFWYVENGGNFFFGHREHLDKWNFTWKFLIFSDFLRFCALRLNHKISLTAHFYAWICHKLKSKGGFESYRSRAFHIWSYILAYMISSLVEFHMKITYFFKIL